MHLILKNAIIINPDKVKKGSLEIKGKYIENIKYEDDDFNFKDNIESIDLDGLAIMAGGIDAHVHFREPGMTNNADINTESKAAVLGGITSFMDMPNTNPPAVSLEGVKSKYLLAQNRSFCNYGFHIGATNTNYDLLKNLPYSNQRDFAGIKVFLGASTGNMLVDNNSSIDNIFSIRDIEIMIHSEDQSLIEEGMKEAKAQFGENIPFLYHPYIRSRKACIKSTAKALDLAIKHMTRLHILHVTTKEEIEMIRAAKLHNPLITAETSANYLWFCDQDYEKLGGLIKCNPAIKTKEDRAALRKAILDGVIDTIGSDHAPHLLEEKQKPYISCPSGIPSIGQSLSVILTIASQDNIPLSRVSSLMSGKVAEMFKIDRRGKLTPGAYADIVVFNPNEEFIVGKDTTVSSSAGIYYKCKWSPYYGTKLRGAIKAVFVNGKQISDSKGLIENKPFGEQLIFKNN